MMSLAQLDGSWKAKLRQENYFKDKLSSYVLIYVMLVGGGVKC